MSQTIRKSLIQDAASFVSIKNKLPLPSENEGSTNGGFLLGTDQETYQFYIENGDCLTAIVSGQIVGFGIVLPNKLVKKSDLWNKRKTAKWTRDITDLEKGNISYFEQLAFLKGYGKLSIRLSYKLVNTVFENGSDFMLTTTVKKPTLNLAAIPFIKIIGGTLIGNIDETYHTVGEINSNIYLICKSTFYQKVKQLSFYDLLKSNYD